MNLNTLLEKKVQQRTAQLEQARDNAQLSLNRLNGIINSTNDLIAASDLEFRLTTFNQAFKQEFKEVYGKDVEIGTSLIDILAHLPEEQAKVKAAWGNALQGNAFTVTQEFGDPTLGCNYYEISFSPLKDEKGQLIGACHIVRNVSDRIRAEKEVDALNQALEHKVIERTQALQQEVQDRIKIEASLRESEEKFRATFNQAAVGIAHLSKEGRFQLINQKLCDMLGYTEAEFLKLTVADITYPEDLAADLGNMQRMLENEIQSFSIEKRYIRKDGSIVWGNLTGSIVREANGEPKYCIGVVEEISDRKQAELALRQSNAILRAINTTTSTMIYAKDLEGRMLMANPAVLVALDKSEAEVLGKTDAQFLPNPSEANQIRENDRRVIETGETQVYEESLDLPVGRVSYLSTKTPYRDRKGRVIGLIGISTNISDRKRIEESLETKNREITNILDSITDGFVSLDKEWRYTYVNPKAEEILGKQERELLGNNMWDVFPEAVDLPGCQYCYQAIDEQTTVEYEEFNPFLGKWLNVRLYPSAQGLTLYFQDITQSKQTEFALQRSEERFRSAIFNAPLPVMMHSEDGEVLLVNEAWTKATGYAHADIPTLAKWAQKAYGERKEPVLALIRAVYQQGKRASLGEFKVNTQFGNSRTWDFHSAPLGQLPDGRKVNIVMAMDMTERKQVEDALRESEQRFRNLADSMPQVIWTANPDGTVDYYNQRVHEFIGFSQQADGTWQWQPVLHPDDAQPTIEAWTQALSTGGLYECEHRVKKADGEFRWHLSRGIPVRDQQDQITKWYGTATDIHAHKQYQAEREELLQREQAARTEAEAASRMKDEFLATLSHELRTPMNSMLGWIVILRTHKLDETTTARALQTIERNTQSLNQLIEDILDISRIIRGKIHLDMQSVNLVTVLESALDTVKATAEAKHIQISSDFDSALAVSEPLVWGDPNRLQQIFWNLLSNAIKFTPQAGAVNVRMSVVCRASIGEEHASQPTPDSTNPTCEAPLSQYAQIQISDTGIGIAPEFLPHVFERFRQADGSITRSHGGLGLGLSIVRQLAELHGGIARAASDGPGQGSTFTIYLPLLSTCQSAETPEGSLNQALRSSYHFLKGMRVVVVDDEPDVRELLTLTLQECGVQVIAVESATSAFEAVRRLRPNVLVSDIGMPTEDGYSLIQRIRELPAGAGSIPAIALTAYASPEDRKKALSAGFHQHISKPINPNELVDAIATIATSKSNSSKSLHN